MKTPASTWWLLFSLYTTQFLGLGFFTVALVAILRQSGASLDLVGLIYALGMIWAIKLLWAPLVDKLALPRFGHYRGWLLLSQSGLILALIALAPMDVTHDFPAVYGWCLAIAVLSATQDIAIDALACRLLPPGERGFGNGIQTTGGLLGNLLGGGAVVMLYPSIGWEACMAVLAVGTSVSLVQLYFFREPAWPARPQRARDLYSRLWTFWRRPGGWRWLGALLLYPLASGLAYGLTTPILVDAGWSLEAIGLLANVVGSLLSALSALATGWLINRWGRRRTLIGAAFFQVVGNLALLLPASGLNGDITIGIAFGLYFLCYSPLSTVVATLMMDYSAADSAGTDYSLQSSLFMLVSMGAATLGSMLTEWQGYAGILIPAAIAALLAVLIALRYRPNSDIQPTIALSMAPDAIVGLASPQSE